MKEIKKILSLFLCCVLLASFAPVAYAEDTLLEEVSAFYTVPAPGEAFNFDSITVPEDAHYSAGIVGVYAQSVQSEKLPDGFIVEEGCLYYVSVQFIPETGYVIDLNETVFYINNSGANIVPDLQLPVGYFVAENKTTTDQWRPLGGIDMVALFHVLMKTVHVLMKRATEFLLTPFIKIFDFISSLVISAWNWIFNRA